MSKNLIEKEANFLKLAKAVYYNHELFLIFYTLKENHATDVGFDNIYNIITQHLALLIARSFDGYKMLKLIENDILELNDDVAKQYSLMSVYREISDSRADSFRKLIIDKKEHLKEIKNYRDKVLAHPDMKYKDISYSSLEHSFIVFNDAVKILIPGFDSEGYRKEIKKHLNTSDLLQALK